MTILFMKVATDVARRASLIFCSHATFFYWDRLQIPLEERAAFCYHPNVKHL